MIPIPTLERLCTIYNLLEQLILMGDNTHVSSNNIEKLTGIASHTIRKDINFLGEVGQLGKGYNIKNLRNLIGEKLCLTKRKAAVVGLGKVGMTIMEYGRFFSVGIDIVAGFDSDINRIDTIKTRIPLFPAREISDIVKEKNIELAFLASSPEAAITCFERLEKGGIKGILNFTPTILVSKNIHIRNMDFGIESTILSAMIGIK